MRQYQIVDMHCDVISKMLQDPAISFAENKSLDANLARLIQGQVKAQCFAIYLSENLGKPRFEHILHSIDVFRRRILNHREMRWIRCQEDWNQLERTNHIGALLSLEGVDGLEGDLTYLDLCFQLGVRLVGFTWNYANWAADGILEPRNGGFTLKGRKLIERCDELGLIMDVSHLSEAGFWELQARTASKYIASHSNARAVCGHVRNLTDEQIKCIISRGGRIGMNFFPPFVRANTPVMIQDLLNHIEHICSLGGSENIMLGSDFDGIDRYITNLEHSGKYENLRNALLLRYPEHMVQGFLYKNASIFLSDALPK
ncbi:dipeptidase [Paenibacillus guangzhouensis]|uniref:dipeptidase n=1 Tax=Paenibacillus guangzhouensis TaxID=1473112 RepID=UPI001266D6B9|nr:membrane dipeptidase [Paenibacillus guangzhouensis]